MNLLILDCVGKDYDVVKFYCDKENEKSQLKQMLKDIINREINTISCHNLNILINKTRDFLALNSIVTCNNTDLVVLVDEIENNSILKKMLLNLINLKRRES